jgi:hypothetical protein
VVLASLMAPPVSGAPTAAPRCHHPSKTLHLRLDLTACIGITKLTGLPLLLLLVTRTNRSAMVFASPILCQAARVAYPHPLHERPVASPSERCPSAPTATLTSRENLLAPRPRGIVHGSASRSMPPTPLRLPQPQPLPLALQPRSLLPRRPTPLPQGPLPTTSECTCLFTHVAFFYAFSKWTTAELRCFFYLRPRSACSLSY